MAIELKRRRPPRRWSLSRRLLRDRETVCVPAHPLAVSSLFFPLPHPSAPPLFPFHHGRHRAAGGGRGLEREPSDAGWAEARGGGRAASGDDRNLQLRDQPPVPRRDPPDVGAHGPAVWASLSLCDAWAPYKRSRGGGGFR
eukprot:scaffold236450_cov33-Tisochrysis_lutea.AAC.1